MRHHLRYYNLLIEEIKSSYNNLLRQQKPVLASFKHRENNCLSDLQTSFLKNILNVYPQCYYRVKSKFEVKIQKQSLEKLFKIGILKNFAKYTGKHLWQGLFFENVGLRSANLLKKTPWHTCFPMFLWISYKLFFPNY